MALLLRFFDVYSKIGKFKRLEGQYEGFSYKNDNDPKFKNYNEISESNGSVANIKYEKDNILSISVDVAKGGGKKWVGHIHMDSEYMGVIPWEYTEMGGKQIPEKTYKNGLKRCSVFENKIIMLHFSEIGNERYGREVFLKNNY